MDGEGGAEYTRDPVLLSPNDPHQSTSTNTQTQREKHKTHWVTAANTHTIQHTSIRRVQKQWRIKRDNLVFKSALSYTQFLCAYPYALLTLTLALFSHPPLNHIRVHTIQLPLLTLAMNLQLFPPWEKWQQWQAFFSTLRHLIILFYLWLFVEGVSPGTPKPQCDQRVKSSVFRSIIP